MHRPAFDGSTIEVSVTGVGRIIGIEMISWATSLDVTKVKGAGQVYRDYTPGIVNAEPGSMEIWLSEAMNWIEKAGGPLAFHNSTFDATITYRNAGFPLSTVVLTGCKPIYLGNTGHRTAGSDNLVMAVDFAVLDVVFNGTGIIGKAISEVLDVARGLGLPTGVPGF
jgi:hypothetical protein